VVTPRFGLSGGPPVVEELAVRSAPRHCPVCGEELFLTRLGCPSCGTELSGTFEACEFCALSSEDRQILRVFLVSRGNMKDLERHLGVSYPTARSRFDALLGRLGLAVPAGAGPSSPGEDPSQAKASGSDRVEVLRRLARGEIDLASAEAALEGREVPGYAEEAPPVSLGLTEEAQ
jgi:hypothetical protein